MKYMLMFISPTKDNDWDAMSEDQRNAAYERIGKWWGEHSEAGRILGGEELQGPGAATTVRRQGAETVVIDGPYMESKESIGGYAVVEVPDLAGAVELAKTWPALSSIEIRPLVEH